MATVAEIREAIKERKARSAWDRGVKEYMQEFLYDVKFWRKLDENDEVAPVSVKELLNGAKSWQQYSEGGSSLVYAEDICGRLCPPSVQKKKKDGDLPPNSTETWLDVQANALSVAAIRFIRLVKRMSKREE